MTCHLRFDHKFTSFFLFLLELFDLSSSGLKDLPLKFNFTVNFFLFLYFILLNLFLFSLLFDFLLVQVMMKFSPPLKNARDLSSSKDFDIIK